MLIKRVILMMSNDLGFTVLGNWNTSRFLLYRFDSILHVISEAALSPASKPESESKDIGGVIGYSVQFTSKSVQKELHSQAY